MLETFISCGDISAVSFASKLSLSLDKGLSQPTAPLTNNYGTSLIYSDMSSKDLKRMRTLSQNPWTLVYSLFCCPRLPLAHELHMY